MTKTEIQGSRVTIVGGARSGLAAARLLVAAGATVFLTDRSTARDGAEKDLVAVGATYEFGGHSTRALDADWFVVSPGVPSSNDIVRQALEAGKSVFSEIEVASWFCPAPIVAITGSNGKTTTTTLLGKLFQDAGRHTIVAGNIGEAFADRVLEARPDSVVVLEVSSFQLDFIDAFRPAVSVSLNITPDHMDRYDHDFNKYAASKARIWKNQRAGDVLVYNDDDAEVRTRAEAHLKANPGVIPMALSISHEVPRGAFQRDGLIVLRQNEKEDVLMEANRLSLRGKHNLYNSLAAAIAARAMEVTDPDIRESLATFEGVPHRLEFIRELDGVRYVNDSKATNVDAVWYALESFTEKVILIAGGRDKGNDYEVLKPLLRSRARGVVAIGESADKVIQDLAPEVAQSARAASMEEAVRISRSMARPGDVVLLSPACASFDMFSGYEQRGDVFRRAVYDLR